MAVYKLFSRAYLLKKGFNICKLNQRSCCNLPSQAGDAGKPKLDGSKKGLVLGVFEQGKKLKLSSAAEEIDQKAGGKLSQHLNNLSGSLKLGKAYVVTDVLPEYCCIALTAVGPADPGYNELEALDDAKENIRWGVGAGVRLLQSRGCGHIDVDPAGSPGAAAEAAVLATWRFQEFKSVDEREPECKVGVYGSQGNRQWERGALRASAQNWARYLSDMPANRMAPVDLAQAALDMLCPLGVVVEARDREWIEAQRMTAFLTVAKGSCETPFFLECTWKGGNDTKPPVLLAAKGVTFDSGGLCLKPAEGMVESRGSMAGAAVVLAAMKILAHFKVPMNVSCVIPICENMISGQCMKVGDVVRALNGMSIQIENTDMEGRLMMADALVYGQALYKPSLVVDVATCSPGMVLATGGGAFGCFSNSDEAWAATRRAGASTGDRPWRFPLWNYYHKQISSEPSVDLRNKGIGKATPCLAAAFLRNFVCCDWIHMDIAGVGRLGHSPAPPYLHPRRMTGRPTRTLAKLLEDIAASTKDCKKDELKDFKKEELKSESCPAPAGCQQ